jgi:hypothetical protein
MGAISAAQQAISDPEVEVLVLVAPAILVWPSTIRKQQHQLVSVPYLHASMPMSDVRELHGKIELPSGGLGIKKFIPATGVDEVAAPRDSSPAILQRDGQGSAGHLNPDYSLPPPALLPLLMHRVIMTVCTGVQLCLLGVLLALRPCIVLLLRLLVRSKAFWKRGLQAAFFEKDRVTEKVCK